MLKTLLFFGAYNVILVASFINPGPKYPATKGEVWPKPQHETKEESFYALYIPKFKFQITGEKCDLLSKAISHYTQTIKHNSKLIRRRRRSSKRRSKHEQNDLDQDANYKGLLRKVQVKLNNPCEEYPHFQMDESYNLTVSTTTKIESDSIWGIMKGLESFSQLFYLVDDRHHVIVNWTEIIDYPRFSHRGLLVDTSRHFISKANILSMLDAMAMNKMNVFHWHIVDDQSFPYESEKFPELSRQGAYHPLQVYTKHDIREVVEYARERGIRVIPEFDVPGHTRSWGIAYPNILTECYENGKVVGLGPMNPTSNATYNLIKELFEEVQQRFPDKYMHIGGDEVELSCWRSNPELQQYMQQNNIKVKGLHSLFMKNVIPLLAEGTQPIVWQEVYDEGVPLSSDTLIHIWKWSWINELVKVLNSGHRIIFSTEWYLDFLNYDFDKLYDADPQSAIRGRLINSKYENNIVGGEACMWSEMVDATNLLSRVWPRASAVAEKLWSPEISTSSSAKEQAVEDAHHRIEEHVCRMNRRGIPAAPASGAGFCIST